MNGKILFALAGSLMLVGSASAGLITTRIEANVMAPKAADNFLAPNEYGPGNSQWYAGSGNGFGGTVGSGTVYMGATTSDWHIGWQPGGNVNDLFTIYFNINGGGTITSSLANDLADGGRRASTRPAANGQVGYPIPVQYTLVFGNFGAVLFELTTTGPINFLAFYGSAGGGGPTFREVQIPWSMLGAAPGSSVDWFGLYTSDDNYLSNEGMPNIGNWVGTTDGAGNPGFNSGLLFIDDFHRFIPTPGAAALLGMGALMAGRRRRA